jgi:hypothetical protein
VELSIKKRALGHGTYSEAPEDGGRGQGSRVISPDLAIIRLEVVVAVRFKTVD